MSFVFRAATEADIPFIMDAERQPGFEHVVGRWDDAVHRAEMAATSSAYFVGERAGAPVGFVIVQGLDDAFGNVLIRRIVAREPGQGAGPELLRGVAAWAFGRPSTHRLWLQAAEHNERARRAYRRFGFVEEGTVREAVVNAAGDRVSMVRMSMLRREWEALER
jgi:RimJ/RimL family protein N-acetyltransferase